MSEGKKLALLSAGFVLMVAIMTMFVMWVITSTAEDVCKSPTSQFDRDLCGYFGDSEPEAQHND